MTAFKTILIHYVLGMIMLSSATKSDFTYDVDSEEDSSPILCSQLFCGIHEGGNEAYNDSSLHECSVLDECMCTTNMLVTCSKLSPKPFFMTYSSFSGQVIVSCKEFKTSFNVVTDYITKMFDVLHIYGITVTNCCVTEEPFSEFTDYGNVTISFSSESVSALNPLRLKKANQIYTATLSNNCFHHISDKFPFELKNLQELDLSSNLLQEIPESIFSNLASLECLKLENNNINTITRLSFQGLKSLISLSLSANKLQNLSAEVFTDLVSLEALDLRYNNIQVLPRNILKKTVFLKQLFLTSNDIETLPATIFNTLIKLVEIDLNYNKLEIIPDGLFDGLTKLEIVRLTNNRLKIIPPKIFRTNRDLLLVDLNDNNLGELGLPELRLGAFTKRGPAQFNITHNNISILDVPLTSRLKISSKLDLSYNCITDLRKSKIKSEKRFHGTGISEFICGNCCLKSIENKGLFQGILDVADLRHNLIQRIDMKFLRSVAHLDAVDISYNLIRSIDVEWSYPLTQDPNRKYAGNPVTTIILHNNPVVCDCHLLPFLKLISNESEPPDGLLRSEFRFDVRDVFCAEPSGPLQGKRISHITEIEYFRDKYVCNMTSECPVGCECFKKAFNATLILNCKQSGFKEFPIVPESEYSLILHLEDNLICNLPSKYSHVWSHLKELHINNNRLTSLENLTISENLTTLSLKDNLLTNFQPLIIFLLQSQSTIKLSLSGNPWECTCEMLKLKPFLFASGNVEDGNLISCIFPNKGKVIYLANATDFVLCPEHHVNIFLMKVLLPTFSLLVVASSLIASISYRYKSEIQLWLFTRGYCLRFVTEDDVDSNKLYDAFISYSTKDENWVALHLVSGLESGNPRYKLCLHNRDWQVGEWIPDQILRSVECSRRTIIVLTDNFVESDWSRLEFQAAYRQALSDQVNRILVVIPYSVPEQSKLGYELSSFVKLNTYIQWEDPYFWRKLRCAMPRVKSSLGPRTIDRNSFKFEVERYFVLKNGYNDCKKQSTL